MANNEWAADDYRSTFGFVAAYGNAVLDLLDAKPGERVLDLGCGTGEHVAALAAADVDVIGIDADEAMLEAARRAHPGLRVEQVDVVTDPPTLGRFDAVLANGALRQALDH